MTNIPAGYRFIYGSNPSISGNQSPIASSSASPVSGTSPLTTVFSSSGSYDPEGKSLTFLWNFGNGNISTLPNPSNVYSSPGNYSATLQVSDGVNTTISQPINVSVASTNSLIAYYPFSENGGTTAVDASGNAHPLTLVNAVWALGKTGGGLRFNGTNSVLISPDASDLDLGSGLTLEAWVFPTTNGPDQNIIFKGEYSYVLALDTSGVPVVGGSFMPPLYGTSVVAKSAWTHLAATCDGTRIRLYVNGSEVASTTQTAAAANGSGPLMIGGHNTVPGKGFYGLIDEVRIYNRALSQGEITTDKGGAAPPPPPQNLRLVAP
jgi:PKD repeat protein